VVQYFNDYYEGVTGILAKVKETQMENITKAARLISESTIKNGIIHTFGAGHSHLVAEDVFWRGATLANLHAILEPSITGHQEISKSEFLEKIENLGSIIFNYHKIANPDVVVVISNSGNNAVAIDFAIEAERNNVKVISISSFEYSNYLKPLHSSKKKLKDFSDVAIDNCCPIGDAILEYKNFHFKFGAVSTLIGIFILHYILAIATQNLISEGFEPDVYINGSLYVNSREAEEHNKKLTDKYFNIIRNL
jgi:uncharacterized phosphosugar-binding protein